MTDSDGYSKLVPGFEFMQNLVKSAGATLPSIGQWVAPTLDPQELDKRIEELRTVQFWLEQNARMLGATIQALEVQRMTLSALQTMNVQMGDLRDSMTLRMADPGDAGNAGVAARAPAPSRDAPAAEPPRAREHARTAAPKGNAGAQPAPASSGGEAGGMIDPMQWWGALTQQFATLAASAMKEGAASAQSAAGVPPAGSAAAPGTSSETPAAGSEPRTGPGAKRRPAAGAARKSAARKRSSGGE